MQNPINWSTRLSRKHHADQATRYVQEPTSVHYYLSSVEQPSSCIRKSCNYINFCKGIDNLYLKGCKEVNLTSKVHTSSFWWSSQSLVLNEKLLILKYGAAKKDTHGLHHLSMSSTFWKVQWTEQHQIHLTWFHCIANTRSKWVSVYLACQMYL